MLYPDRKGLVSLGYMENFVGNLCNFLVDALKMYSLYVTLQQCDIVMCPLASQKLNFNIKDIKDDKSFYTVELPGTGNGLSANCILF